MSDPLTTIPLGPVCPSCGGRISLQALMDVRDELRQRKRERPKPQPKVPPIAAGKGLRLSGGKTVNLGGGPGVVGSQLPVGQSGIPIGMDDAGGGPARSRHKIAAIQIDALMCARCGTFWKPNARDEARQLEEEIKKLRLELYSAVDLLGRVADDG